MSTTYTIFARRESQEALTRIGTVKVEAGASVNDVARGEYGEGWYELVAIPESKMAWAIREEATK